MMKTSIPYRRQARARAQQGAATLIVVMILFFIMAMLAAYANRNLIFEQRIASNYYRSAVALEVADAGAEWTLAMLNGGNLDQTCMPATGAGTQRFSEKYLTLDASSRAITPQPVTPTTKPPTYASCVSTAAAGWVCNCPAVSAWADATGIAAAAQMQPAFSVAMSATNRPGVVKIVSLGCTSSTTFSCSLGQANVGANQLLAGSAVRIEAALVSALKSPPTTPLTVKQTVTDGLGALGLHNTDSQGSGALLVAGGNLSPTALSDSRLESLPGTPTQQAVISSDPVLAGASSDAMFALFFGMARSPYQNQPAIRTIACTDDCFAKLALAYSQGIRMAWITGPATITATAGSPIGTAAAPMVIVVDNSVEISGPLTLTGLLYAKGDITWINGASGLSVVNGAVITEGSFSATGVVDLSYQSAVINALTNATGSFVKVPGSWWDQEKAY